MDDQQKPLSFADTEDWLQEVFTKAITALINEHGPLEQEQLTKLNDKRQKDFPDIISDLSATLLSSIKSDSLELKRLRKDLSDFESRVFELWKKPFDLLEILLGIVFEVGEKFTRLFRPTTDNDYTFEALARLHARGCQVSYEILVLLKSGYPDGAHARWRTLHEIAVTSLFIAKHGDDVAERYTLYNYIESYRTANIHRIFYKGYGEEPPTDEEFEKLEKSRDSLCDRFGKNFKDRYGWALDALGLDSAHFSKIEENVGLDHMRPYYKLASNNVHADPKGVMFKLGVSDPDKVLLAGPTVFGFTQAGHSTAISVCQITYALLSIKKTSEKYLTLKIMFTLVDEIGDAFAEVQGRLESERVSK